MHARFAAEGKPGVTMRSGSNYSTWWNGGLRTTAYFHNQIGLLTETIGDPTPIEIPFVPDRQLPSADLPFPIAPQRVALPPVDRLLGHGQPRGARFRVALSRGAAVRHLPDGEERHRARQPRHVDGVSATTLAAAAASRVAASFERQFRDPRRRDPRAYILPSDQPDFLTATKFVDALLKTGVDGASRDRRFTAGGKSYPAGSFVVKTAQAFRPHVLDMFEPQDHPDDIPYPGWAADAAVRQRRLDARVSDGREVRSRPRRRSRARSSRVDSVTPSPQGRVHSDPDSLPAISSAITRTTRSPPSTACSPRARRSTGRETDRSEARAGSTGAMYIPARRRRARCSRRSRRDLGVAFTGVPPCRRRARR